MAKKNIFSNKIKGMNNDAYKSLFELAEVMFFSFDKDGLITLANKKANEVLECQEEYLIGKNWFDNFIPKHLKNEEILASKKVFSGEKSIKENYNSVLITAKGKEKLIYWNNSVIKNEKGEIIGILSSGIDITESVKINKKIQQLTAAVDQSSNTIVITDVNGLIEYTNPKFTEITGYTAEEVVGKNPRILNAGVQDKAYYENMWKTINSGKSWNGEFCNKSKSGNLFWEQVIISPILNDEGIIINYLAIKEDVTAKKKIEKQLQDKLEDIEIINANSPVIIWKTELDGKGGFKNPYISEAVDDFLALPVGTINNDFILFYKYVKPEYIPKIYAVLGQVFENPSVGYSLEYEVEKANGEKAWFFSFGKGKVTSQNKTIVYGSTVDITKQKKAELNLIVAKEIAEENEVKFKAISNQSTEGITVADMEGNYVYVNPAFCKMSGYTEKELLKLTVFDMKAKYQTHESFFDSKEKYEEIPIRVNLRKKNGKNYITEIIGKVIHVNNQNLVLGTIRDITQRVMFEKNLIESEHFLQETQSVARIGSYVLNITKGVWKSTPVLDDIFGIDASYNKDVSGWLSLVHPKDQHVMQEYFSINILKNHEFFDREYRILNKKSQEMRWVHGMGKLEFDKKGTLVKMTGTIQDITKRKKEEIELIRAKKHAEENEIRFKALHNASFGGITIHDKGVIVDCNLGLSAITGYSFKELIGMDGLLLVAESSREMVMANILSGYENAYDALGLRKNGEEYFLRLEARNIPYRGKQVRVVEFRDVTEQKLVENELYLSKLKAEESDQLKTEFINNMSHEIRTPLNAIMGFTDFLNIPNLPKEQHAKYTGIIQKSSNQLLKIVDDVLEISRLGTQQVEINNKVVCLNDLLKNQFDIFEVKAKERQLNLSLKTGLPTPDSYLKIDEGLLLQIMNNLLENAIKFTNEGGIEFGYSISKGDTKRLDLYVKDSGIGVAYDKQETIFKRFSQEEKELNKKVGGLGLGLSIALESAKLMGGNITLNSEKGIGSTFHVSIPYYPVASKKGVKEDGDVKAKKRNGKKQKTVLVADDEKVNLLYLVLLLKEFKFTVLEAVNGKEAVNLCKLNPEIDLVFMDLKMPIMSGFDAAKSIREFRPNLPIVAQTAYTTREEESQALLSGCNDFISKPLDKVEVYEKINKFLSK